MAYEMDSYLLLGTALAMMAGAVLLLRQPKRTDDEKLRQEMLRIGQQMKMYKQAASKAEKKDGTGQGSAVGKSTQAVHGMAKNRKMSVDEDEEAFPGGRVAILFGSQTGTAEGFADVLKKEGRKHGFATHAIDLEEYNAVEDLAHERCVIFVMATYGEGDPTDNAVDFVNFLKNKDKSLDDDAFQGVSFTVFGLGNSQYEQFNATGRFVDKFMEKYGAQRVYHYGEGDDDKSIDEDFEDWKEQLWKGLRAQFIAGAAETDAAVANEASAPNDELCAPELAYNLVEIPAPKGDISHGNLRMKSSTKHFFTAPSAKVIVNRELRQSTCGGSTVHMEFDLRETGVEYVTADNLAVLPENSSSIVDRLAKRLGYDLEQWVAVQPVGDDTNDEIPFPTPCTIERILTCYLEIGNAPRKGPLKTLAYYACNAEERARLLHLASKEGKDDYHDWIIEAERSYVDVIEHFRSIKLPLAALLEVVPFLQPRYYTISSSSTVNPQRVHITVSVISREKEDGRIFNGVCSSFLAGLKPLGSHVDKKKKRESRPGEQGVKQPREWPRARIFVRPSTFRLPPSPSTPILLIGPGTGIAPMRAFLQERAHQLQQGVEVGPTILYFGCRRREEDYIYKDELSAFQSDGVLLELHVAFSREQENKVYVQHLLKEHGQRVYQLIAQKGAYIFVCGATSMGNDVHKVLHEIIMEHAEKSADDAAQQLKHLQDTHRYVQELWA